MWKQAALPSNRFEEGEVVVEEEEDVVETVFLESQLLINRRV
jgi:hypothetical protein